MSCPNTWTVKVHIVLKYKYSHYNSINSTITSYLQNIGCENVSIAVSLIQYIMFVKNTFYITPYVLSHAKIIHFLRN